MQEEDQRNKHKKIEREGQAMIDPQINNVDPKFLRLSVTYTGYVSQITVIFLSFSSTPTKRTPIMDPNKPSSSAIEGHHLMQI